MAGYAENADSKGPVKFPPPVVYLCEEDIFESFQLQSGRLLGEGSSGYVVETRSMSNKANLMATKIFPIGKDTDENKQQEEQFLQEVAIMNGIIHPNLMCQVTAAKCPTYWAIIMKHCPRDALDEVLRHERTPAERLDRFTAQLSSAVRCLHNSGVYHRDIKLENILIDSNGDLVLSDFGHAQILPSSSQIVTVVNGNIPYVGPEADSQWEMDAFKLDAFAVGVVIWSLATHLKPLNYEPERTIHLMRRMPTVSAVYRTIIRNLLQRDPSTRWSVKFLCQQLKKYNIGGHLVDE